MESAARNKPRRLPAEWERHRACWLAWPSHEALWRDDLEPARREFSAFCRFIGSAERLEILVLDGEGEAEAAATLGGLDVRFHRVPFGDIWLRDTGPLFCRVDGDRPCAVAFRFNGWGGKYVFDHDDAVATAIATRSGYPLVGEELVLEGGSIDVDGEATVIATRQCLLNENRNPHASEGDVEEVLRRALGAEATIWLDEGLKNDHTDGHVDTLARFVGPAKVACMRPSLRSDPNRDALLDISAVLAGASDAGGRSLELVHVPSPGRILDSEGALMPASYLNFYIANGVVAVPTYDAPADAEAVEIIRSCFPDRSVEGLSARAILTGGGAFHCITQQEPDFSATVQS